MSRQHASEGERIAYENLRYYILCLMGDHFIGPLSSLTEDSNSHVWRKIEAALENYARERITTYITNYDRLSKAPH